MPQRSTPPRQTQRLRAVPGQGTCLSAGARAPRRHKSCGATAPTDLTELERLLLEAGIADQQDLDRAAREASGLGLFVRSLVGLDRESATAAFEEFLSVRTLSANQLDFVNLIIAGLTESGVVEVGRLYESPFTDVAPQGPDAMFASGEVDSLLDILIEVRARAVPAAELGSAS